MVSNNIIIPSKQCTADSIHCQGSTQLLIGIRGEAEIRCVTPNRGAKSDIRVRLLKCRISRTNQGNPNVSVLFKINFRY